MATAVPFAPILRNDFVNWDDYEMLLQNPNYRGWAWPQVRWMFSTFYMGHFQPLSWLSFGLDYLIWGSHPAGYHLTNLLLHVVNAVIFFFIAQILLAHSLQLDREAQNRRLAVAAGVAALLFSIHPLRVESVAWATERRDVLSGVFFFLTLYCYLRSHEKSKNLSCSTWSTLSVIAYLLSLLAKATAITLPLVLLVLDFYPLRRLSGRLKSWLDPESQGVLREKVPFVILAVVFAVLAIFAQHSAGALRPAQQYFLSYRLGQSAYGVVFYLWKSILPFRLSPLYELPYDFAPWSVTFLLCAILVLAITIGLLLARDCWPAGLACWIYYLAMLAPVLGIAQSGPQLVADRYSYLSCASWAILAAGAFLALCDLAKKRIGATQFVPAVMIITVVVLIGLSVGTWQQTAVWHDTRTLWRRVIAVGPPSSIAHYNLGQSFEAENQFNLARDYYRQAVEINPANPDAHYNLARLLAKQNDSVEAMRHYRLALEVRPNDADTHNNLGLLLARTGELEAALQEFDQAVRIDPNYGKAFFNMGRVLERQDKFDEAIQQYNQALQLNPGKFEILIALGDALLRKGETDRAVSYLANAVREKPDLPQAHEALARALLARGDKSEAELHYAEAVRLLKAQNEILPSARRPDQ